MLLPVSPEAVSAWVFVAFVAPAGAAEKSGHNELHL
jgi:hypothetical protein